MPRLFTTVALLLVPIVADAQLKTPDWVRVTERAGWQPRDSQGEVAYRGRLWIFGGWFNSFSQPPRDVWSSPDGVKWTRVTKTAPWRHSDLSMSLEFADRMWFMGGWTGGRLPGHSSSNAVWSSTDGANWERVTKNAGWSPRVAAATVVFKKRMWMLGGTESYYFGDASSVKNDVWSSADGATWTLATARAAWSPRAYHQAAVLGGRIYLFGGGNYVPTYEGRNDVWSSADGVNWRRETEHAPWGPRLWFSAAVYRDRMWVLGGWSNNPSTNLGDIWVSKNGRDWTELKADVTWKARHEHSVYVLDDKLWVVGGHARPLVSDAWSLELPRGWFDKATR